MKSPQVRPREVHAVLPSVASTVQVASGSGVAVAPRVLPQSCHPALRHRTQTVVSQHHPSAPLIPPTSVPATPVVASRTLAEPSTGTQSAATVTATPGATRVRRSEPPPTPLGAHREVVTGRIVPASPSVEYRSPAVQYRTVTVIPAGATAPAASSTAAPVAAYSSPVVRMRTGNLQPAAGNSPVTIQTALGSPSAASLLQQAQPEPSGISWTVTASAARADPGSSPTIATAALVQDPSVQKTVSMLPPTPGNTLAEFLNGVVSGEIEPAMCSLQPDQWMDAARYWEKRRVQNSLRRLLEALQDAFGVDGDTPAPNLAAMVFDELLRQSLNTNPSLDEEAFIRGIEALNAWPPELNSADRSEVFAALRAPTMVAARALSVGQPLPQEITQRMFCQGLSCLPYNVPDFPVPRHLLINSKGGGRDTSAKEAADAIAIIFSIDPNGLDRLKDFFLSGLISLEEIQAVLPRLLPESLVEEAVTLVIRKGAELFTTREWQTLVVPLRVPPPEAEPGALAPEQLPPSPPQPPAELPVSLSTPEVRHRQLAPPSPSPSPDGAPAPVVVVASPGSPGGATSSPAPLQSASQREVRSEEPVRFQAASCPRIINWSSTGSRDLPGGSLGHQADEGAGMRPAGQERAHTPVSDQAVRLISMDMHNECLGPFLTRAFVRCCLLYEAHCIDTGDQ